VEELVERSYMVTVVDNLSVGGLESLDAPASLGQGTAAPAGKPRGPGGPWGTGSPGGPVEAVQG